MTKLCRHDAYLTDRKHREYENTTQFMYYGHNPPKMLSLDSPLTRNKIGRPNHCGAYLIATLCFTSK